MIRKRARHSTTREDSSAWSTSSPWSSPTIRLGLAVVAVVFNIGWLVRQVVTTAWRPASVINDNKSSTTPQAADGCGLEDGIHPRWVQYTDADHEIMTSVAQCIRDIPDGIGILYFRHLNNADAGNNFVLKKLLCDLEVTPSVAQEALRQFRRVQLIGDSVLVQQFFSLLCLVDPEVTKRPVNHNSQDIFSWTWEHASNNIHTHANGTNTTLFQFARHGIQYTQMGEGALRYNLYRDDFPTAIRTFTAQDLILVNSGMHYAMTDAHQLHHVASFVANASLYTNATVVFIETSDQQWPTANGIFAPGCQFRCQCEPLTPLRLQGMEIPWDNGPHHVPLQPPHVNQTRDLHPLLQTLYPNHIASIPNTTICVPDCAPPNWRNELVRPLLLQGNVHIVPTWRQLVAMGKDHSNLRDCTHVTLEASLAMNQQLIRTLILRQQAQEQRF